jgi:hypothetical protein
LRGYQSHREANNPQTHSTKRTRICIHVQSSAGRNNPPSPEKQLR